MAPKPSIHSGGYNPEAAERLARVTIPDKIKCVQCKRNFMHAKFSKKQINEYRQQLLLNQNNAKPPKCRQCVGSPADELTCHRCDLTKGLSAFTKVQRRNPDTALCKDCQQEVSDQEPGIDAALQEEEILNSQKSIGSYSLSNYSSLWGSLAALNSRTGDSGAESADGPTTSPNNQLSRFGAQSGVAGNNGDGVWVDQNVHGLQDDGLEGSYPAGQRAPSLVSSPVSNGSTGTAWDQLTNTDLPAQGYRSRLGSTQTNATAQMPKRSTAWAKQGAAKPDRGGFREAERQREAILKMQEQVRAEEEDSDGSEYEL